MIRHSFKHNHSLNFFVTSLKVANKTLVAQISLRAFQISPNYQGDMTAPSQKKHTFEKTAVENYHKIRAKKAFFLFLETCF